MNAVMEIPDSLNEPAQISNPRVLLIVLNPTMDESTGQKLATRWAGEGRMSLVRRFIAEVLQASGGLVRYQVAERVELD